MSAWLTWSRHRPAASDAGRLRLPQDGLPPEAVEAARRIIEDVRARGDEALIDATHRFDRVLLEPGALRVQPEEVRAAATRAPAPLRAAMDQAIRNIRTFHEAQRPRDLLQVSDDGATLGWLWHPVQSAGLYVPGGRAAYPTSLLMNAIPARVAGVPRLAAFTVPGTVEANPAVAYALEALEIDEVWRVGGAQAIAAAALGTSSVRAVDVIVGPGNAYVAAAKRLVYGSVGIDSIAGPSEVLIVADEHAPADWIALDLVAQAEHDPEARCLVASPSRPLLQAVADEVERLIEASPRREIVAAAWRDHGALVLVEDVEDLVALAAWIAPEHLQVMVQAPVDTRRWVGGAVFVGAHTPTALGDYIAGPNHVLPTGSTARFSGPLSVYQFLRPSSLVVSDAAASARMAEPGALIADYEGLPGHAAALRARLVVGEPPAHAAAPWWVENVQPAVRALKPYTLKATEAPVKLNQNESPWDIAPEVKARILQRVAARSWNRYPDFHPADVLEGIGVHHGLRGDNVLLGNGSNELIQAVLTAVVHEGQPVAYPEPTFTLYAMMIAAYGGVPQPVPLDGDLGYDEDAWRAVASRGRAHLLLCSPNNPTGSMVSTELVRDLCRRTRRLVILDEAYAPFAPADHAALLHEHPNLVLLRTFSKAAGLAGVRLGYALAAAELAREIHKVKLPYNVGVLGLEVAREAIAHPALFDGHASALRDERSRLEVALRALPLDRVWTGGANFVLVRTRNPSALAGALYADGVLVRDVSHYPGLAGCLRLSVGSPDENVALLAALEKHLCRDGGADAT